MRAGSSTSASIAALVAVLRFSVKLAVVLGGTVVLGFVAPRDRRAAMRSGGRRRSTRRGSRMRWVMLPSDLGVWAPVSYIVARALRARS